MRFPSFSERIKLHTKKPGLSFFPWKSFLLMLALDAGLTILGTLLPRREDSLYSVLWLTDFFGIVLAYLANWLYSRHWKRWGQKAERDLHAMKAELDARKSTLEADLDRAATKLDQKVILAWCYYFVILLIVGSGILLSVAAGVVFAIMPFCYILWSLLEIFFRRESREDPGLELERKDYPSLYSLAEQAAKATGCQLPLRLFAGGRSVAISHSKQEVWLLLDAVSCSLLTKEELYPALLHEFAHELNGDTRYSLRFERETLRWEVSEKTPILALGGYLVNIPDGIVSMEYFYYDLFSRKYRETQADREAVCRGDAQALVNGLAKLCVWDMFENEPNPAISLYWEYAADTPREDLPAHALSVFRAALPSKAEAWRHRLDVELPPRVATHPIFRERREALGITDYRFDMVENDAAYRQECDAMLALTGKAIAKELSETYQESRKVIYTDRKALIDRAKTVTDWSALSMDERIELAKALAIQEPELQETAIESILAEDPENCYGTMILAVKRFRENDPACVELLKRAAELNHNFADDAYDYLGEYAARNGLQDLLEEYRTDVIDVAQNTLDRDREIRIDWKGAEVLTENQLPPPVAEEVRQAIVERSEGMLLRLYTVQKHTSAGPTYFYALQFSEDLPPEERERLYGKVFLYLDYREEQFSLYDVTGQKKQQSYLLKKVPGCAISTKLPG